MAHDNHTSVFDISAVYNVIGVCILFALAIGVTAVAPNLIDASWTSPASEYQYQMYRVADPHYYISVSQNRNKDELVACGHLQKGFTLQAYMPGPNEEFVGPQDLLAKYVTTEGPVKLTSDILLLRRPIAKQEGSDFDAKAAADAVLAKNPQASVWELYMPKGQEAFVLRNADGAESWTEQFTLVNKDTAIGYHNAKGLVFVKNPIEFKVHKSKSKENTWEVRLVNEEPVGESIASLAALKDKASLAFMSREELISMGETLYAQEGCWYCHTDQTRTLPQDSLINASANYPAPPSSSHEYAFQKITFPGTRRIGPDLSRVGVKREGRDWHMAHFWDPKSPSPGSIMPPFQHFFYQDPRGYKGPSHGLPNTNFEAMYQYLMTKGTRITSPDKAWWKGENDPTLAIIDGRYKPESK